MGGRNSVFTLKEVMYNYEKNIWRYIY
jgi:hypothetical protein